MSLLGTQINTLLITLIPGNYDIWQSFGPGR
jgi:hypothetical protein